MAPPREVLSVGQCMSRRPEAVSADCPIGEALRRMEQAGIRHLLVEDGPLVGVLSNRDLRRLPIHQTRGQWLAEPVRRIMSEDPVTVPPEMPVTEAAHLLLDERIGALPVRDGDEVVGIFTTSDALEALLALVEERPR
jgi:acetoin utilization protein AcuB